MPDGTFEGGASVGGGAAMSSTTISFRTDGTFTRSSTGSISSAGTAGTVSGGSSTTQQGKYRIEGMSVHLIPIGGKETIVSYFPYDDGIRGPAPRKLYFGGGMLNQVH